MASSGPPVRVGCSHETISKWEQSPSILAPDVRVIKAFMGTSKETLGIVGCNSLPAANNAWSNELR